jgi:hypothetical protein
MVVSLIVSGSFTLYRPHHQQLLSERAVIPADPGDATRNEG